MKNAIIGILALLILVGGYFTFISSPWNTFCPGIQTNDLSTMDKRLSKKMMRIMDTLDKEGFKYTISSVYRSPGKQQCYYDISQVVKKISGQNGLTQVTKSCHNNIVGVNLFPGHDYTN